MLSYFDPPQCSDFGTDFWLKKKRKFGLVFFMNDIAASVNLM